MYDLFLLLSFCALLFSPYILNAWCDWSEMRAERRAMEVRSTRLVFAEDAR